MALKLRIRKIEERLGHALSGKKLQTICFLSDGAMPTDAETEAALNDYKATHPDWDTEDLIEIRLNAR